MDFILTGWPAFIFLVGFVVVFSTPVWLAARLIGAKHPTLWRAVASLAVGMPVSILLAILTGPWGFLLAPVGFLLSFKYILGTSFLGAVLLAIVAGLGYVVIGYLISGVIPGIPGLPGAGQGITV
jgi:hypothetical protein